MVQRLLVCFLLISATVFAQFPTGLDIQNISKRDLKKYGISESDYEMFKAASTEGGENKNTEKEVSIVPITHKPDSVFPQETKNDEEEIEQVYGRDFFENENLKVYKSTHHVKASENYIVGVGDEISVNIWGYSEHSGLYQVNENGAISIKSVGNINVKGLKYSQVKSLIKRRLSKVYDLKNSSLTIEINYSKVIRVNLVGEVKKPGTYTVSPLNSAFNILGLAGGITENGSVRKIMIVRGGKVVKVLDVYNFLFNPIKNFDFHLIDNDFVVVGTKQNIIELRGEVAKPGKYEVLPTENLNDLIKFGGGPLRDAFLSSVEVISSEKNGKILKSYSIEDLEKSKEKISLSKGDVVVLNALKSDLRNYVTLKGEFSVPGKYEWNKNMKLLDAIQLANGTQFNAYNAKGYIKRVKDDLSFDYLSFNYSTIVSNPNSSENYELKEFDEISISSKKLFVDSFYVEIYGAVRKNARMIYSEKLTLGDLVFFAGGIKPEADLSKIEISRISNFDEATKNSEATKIEILNVKVDPNDPFGSKVELKPNDHIFVRTTPDFEIQQKVYLNGEVKYPGVYTLLKKGETLKELIERAGGLTEWASYESASLERADVGNLVMNIDRLMKGDDDYNYPLVSGDRINIPKNTSIVTVIGAIEYAGIDSTFVLKVPYIKGKRAKYFINKFAAGFDDDAKKSSTIVINPGGYAKKTKNWGLFKIYPKVNNGDEIKVSYKKKKEPKEKKEPINWNSTIESFTIKITGLLTLYILSQNAFN